MKKQIFMFGIIPIILLVASTAQYADASIFGSFGQGYDFGKQMGQREFGTSTDATCPSGHSDSFCIGYHVGFDEEQAALGLAQR